MFSGASAISVLVPALTPDQYPQKTLQDLQVGPVQLLLCPGSPYVGNLVFPPSCGVPALKPCWSSESYALGVPPSSARTSGWGADVGLRTLKRTGEILQYDFFKVCGSLIWWEWDLIVVKVAFLPSHCSCFFFFDFKKKCFLVGSSLFH